MGGVKDLRRNPRAGNRPRSFLLLLGLSAIIAGIIGMHLWTGGHAQAEHHAPAPTPVAVGSPTGMGEMPLPGEGHGLQAGPGERAGAADPASLSAPYAGHDHGMAMFGCAGACDAGDMAMGLCVLALTVLTLLAFAVPPNQGVPGPVMRRGPPRVFMRSLPAPAPSLTRLCISRT